MVFQKVIFGNWEKAAPLREAASYADIYDDPHELILTDEYWYLYYKFGGQFRPPENPQPLLGWVGHFDRYTLKHQDHDKVKGRIPVLFFGDSFSICVGAKCFEEILNEDSTFASKYYLLNYGVGGYGVDQIYLLAREVIPMYDNPVVFFGFMTRDMDRNILKFRTGQKPYFEIDNDQLVLKNTPIDPDPAEYVENNMPYIPSYIMRYLRNSIVNYIPANDYRNVRKVEHMKNLNAKILSTAQNMLERDSIHYRFLVFSALWKGDREWRNIAVRDHLERNNVPYLWVRDMIEQDAHFGGPATAFFEDANNGHPTTYQNELICDAMMKSLFDSTYAATIDSINTDYYLSIRNEYDLYHIDHYAYKIRRDPNYMIEIKRKAEERGISVDSMHQLDSRYLLEKFKRAQFN